MPKIGINGSSPCCSQCGRFQASTGFSPFKLLYGLQPCWVLDVIREAWEEGPSNSGSEIQYVLDLRAKLHTLGWLSMENLLQAQDTQSQLYNRGNVNLHQEVKCVYYFQRIALSYSQSGKDLLWSHGKLGISIIR